MAMADVPKLLENTKREIRSVLLAAPKGSELTKFCKDYRGIVGQKIPFQSFGYHSVEEFLGDIPDVVCMRWYQQLNSFVLTAVADESTKHIEKLVSKQKVTKHAIPGASSRRRLPYIQTSVPPRLRVSSQLKPIIPALTRLEITQLVKDYPNGLMLANVCVAYKKKFGKDLPYFQWGYSDMHSFFRDIPGIQANLRNGEYYVYMPPSLSSANREEPKKNTSAPFLPLPLPGGAPLLPLPGGAPLLPLPGGRTKQIHHITSSQSSKLGVSRPNAISTISHLNTTSLVSKPSTTSLHNQPNIISVPSQSNTSSTPSRPSTSSVPSRPSTTSVPSRPSTTSVPSRPSTTAVPSRPSTTSVPSRPSTTSVPGQPSIPSVPQKTEHSYKTVSKAMVQKSASSPILEAVQSKINKIVEEMKGGGTSQLHDPTSSHLPPQTKDLTKSFFNGLENSINRVAEVTDGNWAAGYQKSASIAAATNFLYEPKEILHSIPKVPSSSTISHMDILDDITPTKEFSSMCTISENMKQNFRKILRSNPNGVWCAELPDKYEQLTGNKFDLSELGYFTLLEFVDHHSDLFLRVQPQECKSDWLLLDPKGRNPLLTNKSESPYISRNSACLDNIISNVRRILVGNSEGVYLDDFIHLYSLNCEAPLILSDYGWDSVENFLIDISERVPLKIKYNDARKKVYFGFEPVVYRPRASASGHKGIHNEIPNDAVMNGRLYEWEKLPENITEYISVYIGTVDSPSSMWIQLRGEKTSGALTKLMEDLDVFYSGPTCDLYTMHENHIVIGAVCAAIWSGDKCWHRISISSMSAGVDFVDATFVDYGTRGKVSRNNLRYLKEEFFKLPAQAIKVKLAFLVPRHGDKWDPRARDKILEIVTDKPIMAQIVEEPDFPDIPSVYLCDVSEEEDVYISHLLIGEGYAVDYRTENVDRSEIPVPDPLPVSPNVSADPVDLVSAFNAFLQLQRAASVITSTEELVHYLSRSLSPSQSDIIKQLMSSTAATGNVQPAYPNYASTQGYFSHNSSIFPSNTNPFRPHANQSSGSYMGNQSFVQTSPHAETVGTTIPNSFGMSNVSRHKYPESKDFIRPPINPSGDASLDIGNMPAPDLLEDLNSDEMFDDEDDDDEVLEKFCANVNLASRRFVRRVKLRDGYRIHIIVVDTRPYMSCGDLSFLFWSNEDTDYLDRRLRGKDIAISSHIIMEAEYPHVFHQLRCLEVKGIKPSSKEGFEIMIYPLKSVLDILNIFGHPSCTIRNEIDQLICTFNLADDMWKHFIQDNDEELSSAYETDSDKFKKMCIYDLKATMEGLRYKRLKHMSSLTSEGKDVTPIVEEIKRIETQLKVYDKRVKEIQTVMSSFQPQASSD